MRDPMRIPRILKHIQQEWELRPDWRLGQVLLSLLFGAIEEGRELPGDLFYVEDDIWEGQGVPHA